MRTKKGFTLAEVIIAVGIIAIMAAMMASAFNHAKPDKTKLMFLKAYDGLNEAVIAMGNNQNLFANEYETTDENGQTVTFDITNCPFLDINAPIDYAYESILLLSKREFIFNTASAIDIFIDKINPKKTEFSKSIKNIINKMKEKRDIQTIKTCNKKLIELEILKEEEKENKLINIFINFKKQPDSIRFLLETTSQDLGSLQEMATLNDSNIVNANDILDMQNCLNFFAKIGTLNEIMDMKDIEIISQMYNKVKEVKDIDVYFERYVSLLSQLAFHNSPLFTSGSVSVASFVFFRFSFLRSILSVKHIRP